VEHYGVYGIWRQNGLVVAIRKGRGPYLGMLDLPGGSPQPGEAAIETLERELREECGITRVSVSSWHAFDFQVDKSSFGEPIEFHHRGLIALVTVQGEVHFVENVEDVESVELIDPTQHAVEEFTPAFAYAVALLDSEADKRGY
jgi:8-oxo-dGTP pyrophosphatase MutT (NUDIX family)